MKRACTFLVAGLLAGWALPAAAQEFGGSVLMDDGRLIISESVDPAGATPDGTPRTLYVYSPTGSGWEKTGEIQAPAHDGADFFGRFVLLDGDRLLVGATALDENGDGNSDGSVLIYRRDGDGWTFDSTLRPESVPLGSSYGRFAAMGGDLLVVTALGYEGTGGAWVFERGADGGWIEQQILTPSDPESNEFFGYGVDTDGERIIVGAFHGVQTQQAQTFPGAAYVFGRDANGQWVEEGRLQAPDADAHPIAAIAGNRPAIGVGILGNDALLGLPGYDAGAGAALHFVRRSSGDWVLDEMLTAFDRQPGAAFGAAMYGVGDQVWIAAPGADKVGAIYRFSWNPDTGVLTSATKLSAGTGTDAGDGFGLALAAGDDVLAIGQPVDDGGLGSVVVMREQGGEWAQTAKIFIPEDRRALAELSDVSCSDDGMADQFSCEQVDVLSFLPLDAIGGTDRGIQTNDVWGWTDPQTNREYAIVGRTDGTAFIDVSNPSAPVYLGNLAKTPGSITNVWRDIKVYENHAYVVADNAGEHGMQVFDLTRLRDVTNAPVEFEPDALYDGIASAHNVVINEESGFAYVVGSSGGGDTCGGGLHMVDIHDPLNPTFVGCFADAGTGRAGTGYSHDAQCIMYNGPDAEHAGREICFGANENALSIADVTDKGAPVKLSSASYPNVAYTHQGWVTPDHRYFFLGDELDEMANVQQTEQGAAQPMQGTRTLIWDISDLDDPVLVKEHFGETFTIDHNLYIVDDLVYQSNYVSGLRVLDISDPENPTEVGFFDTVPWDESVVFDGSWSNYPFFESGTIVVSSGQEGVFFLKYRRPELVP